MSSCSTTLFSLDEAPWRVTFAPARVLALVLEVGLRVVSGEGERSLNSFTFIHSPACAALAMPPIGSRLAGANGPPQHRAARARAIGHQRAP